MDGMSARFERREHLGKRCGRVALLMSEKKKRIERLRTELERERELFGVLQAYNDYLIQRFTAEVSG